MIMLFLSRFAALTLAATSVLPATAQEAEKTAKVDAPARSEPVMASPAMPNVQPTPMAGFDNDSAYVQSIADRLAELASREEQADRLVDRVDLWLHTANLLLAYQIEPACTRGVLQIHSGKDRFDKAALRKALDHADRYISQAGDAIGKLGEREDAPGEWLAASRHRWETLEAFSSALRAYLLPGEGAEAARATRRAASGLSPLLEDANRQVAAAASFWQASVRGRETDPGPALSVLDLALADPRPDSMPYAFFGRILRCRLVADRGSPDAALALLLQIEERCQDWFEADSERADAVRAAQLVRVQILARWHERLREADAPAERQWCADRIKALVVGRFGDSGNTVLRLTPAIPIIAPL